MMVYRGDRINLIAAALTGKTHCKVVRGLGILSVYYGVSRPPVKQTEL